MIFTRENTRKITLKSTREYLNDSTVKSSYNVIYRKVVKTMSKISVEELNGFYRELAEDFSVDIAIKMHEYYGGLQMTFPQNLVSKESLHKKVVDEYNGSNARQLAKKYGYTERWVKKILSYST